MLRSTGDPTTAIGLKRGALAIARADPEARAADWPIGRWIPALLTDLGHLLLEAGQENEGRTAAEEALAIRRDAGQPAGIAHALAALVQIEDSAGRIDRAYGLAREGLGQFEVAGEHDQETVGLRAAVSEFELLLGRPLAAVETLASAVEGTRGTKDVANEATVLRVGTALALSFGQAERSMMLLSAVERLSEETGVLWRSRIEVERDRASVALPRRHSPTRRWHVRPRRGEGRRSSFC